MSSAENGNSNIATVVLGSAPLLRWSVYCQDTIFGYSLGYCIVLRHSLPTLTPSVNQTGATVQVRQWGLPFSKLRKTYIIHGTYIAKKNTFYPQRDYKN